MIGESFGESDHNSVTFTIVMEKDVNKRGTLYSWGRGNYEGMKSDLRKLIWDRDGGGPEEKWKAFKDYIQSAMEKHVPS